LSDQAGSVVGRLREAIAAPARGAARGDSLLVGLIGRGIQSSRSPAMHEREAARLGIGCQYVLLDFDRLGLPDEALPAVVAAGPPLGFRGFNVTHPFKQQIVPLLDSLSPAATAIGAVNTIVYAGGRTSGHNTDSWGFAESFRRDMAGVPLSKVVQFGAGGAGSAVAHALMQLGVEDVTIVDVEPQRAGALAERMRAHGGSSVGCTTDVEAALGAADGLVNTTPVGMAKYPGLPFPAPLLQPRHWVAEIVYFPDETELLRHARSLGCRTLAGSGMAIAQAARAFELFTGKAPDMRAMAAHFEAAA
jgi:shikimate dehydrogenase